MIFLDYSPAGLSVSIADNGTGFNTNEKTKSGIGLNNIHLRSDLLKANLQVTSQKDKGTTIKLHIDQPEPINFSTN